MIMIVQLLVFQKVDIEGITFTVCLGSDPDNHAVLHDTCWFSALSADISLSKRHMP